MKFRALLPFALSFCCLGAAAQDPQPAVCARNTGSERFAGTLPVSVPWPPGVHADLDTLWDGFMFDTGKRGQAMIDWFDTDFGTREFAVRDPNGYLLIFAEPA